MFGRVETSPFICRAYQWAGFYLMETSVMKELRHSKLKLIHNLWSTSTLKGIETQIIFRNKISLQQIFNINFKQMGQLGK